MNEVSQKSIPMTLKNIPNVTFSRALEDGLTHYDWLDGRTKEKSGQEAVLANHSVQPEKRKALQTNGTYGPLFDGLSQSADLQSFLENRLRANLDVNGSMEYALTWKRWDMRSGPPICALRASAHRISDKGCSGWPTPNSMQRGAHVGREIKNGQTKSLTTGTSFGMTLQTAAWIAGWPPPECSDRRSQKSKQQGVSNIAKMAIAGWTTPQSDDAKPPTAIRPGRNLGNEYLRRQVTGAIIPSSPVPTEKRGALNPELCRWLMGYPVEWEQSRATAMPLSRNARQHS